jgi:hypothetical protein
LSSHLEKCPSKPQALPGYVQLGVNSTPGLANDSKLSIRDVSDEKLIEIIDRVDKIYESEIRIKDEIQTHAIVEEEMSRNSSFFGPEVLKHLVQNSSLLGSLSSKELLNVRPIR